MSSVRSSFLLEVSDQKIHTEVNCEIAVTDSLLLKTAVALFVAARYLQQEL